MVLMHNICLYISVTFLQVQFGVLLDFFPQNLVKFILRTWLSAHDYIVISSWQQWTYNNFILRSISFNKMYICIYFRPLLEFLSFFCEFGGFLWKIYNSSGSQRVKALDNRTHTMGSNTDWVNLYSGQIVYSLCFKVFALISASWPNE